MAKKILLIDDDTFLLDMYATKFTEAGFTVDSAKTTEVALEKLRGGEQFDVILLDMVMPGLSGIDLLKAVRDEKIGGTPKCIVLSNQSEDTDIQAALDVGATGYIVKAESIPSEVLSKVEEYIEK